jgi:hypothetical protein
MNMPNDRQQSQSRKVPAYRIGVQGSTPQIVQQLSTQFGFDVSKLGNASAGDANELRNYANAMKVQVEIAKSLMESIKVITECTVQIEALRKEAIEASLKRKEEIEKMVSQLEVAVAKHQQTLLKISQDTQHGIQLAQRKGRLDLTAGKNRFKLELMAMRKKAIAQMKVDKQVITQKSKDDVEQIRQQPTISQQRSKERRQFTNFINGKDPQGRPTTPANAFFN